MHQRDLIDLIKSMMTNYGLNILQVKHVVRTSAEVMKMGKCVVIGLQSTGEARTMEALEREEELTDFVSTAKGVLQVSSAYSGDILQDLMDSNFSFMIRILSNMLALSSLSLHFTSVLCAQFSKYLLLWLRDSSMRIF